MIKKIIIKTVRAYQVLISPFLGRRCRFYPSCSNYCILSVKKYGALKGVFLSFKRLLRCHPWRQGGVDFP